MPELSIEYKEKIGIIFAMTSSLLWGFYPIIVHTGLKAIAPLTFAGLSLLLAAGFFFIYVLLTKSLHELKQKTAYFPLLMVALLVVIVPSILYFIGAKYTSGINITMLLQVEIIFTLLFTPLFGEPTTRIKLLSGGGIFLGAMFILYNGSLSFNWGDLLIILSTITFPFGNFYAKRALNMISPATILFIRSIIGGSFILVLALFLEPQVSIIKVISNNWLSILLMALLVYAIGKAVWYEALKHLDISKAIALTSTFPLIGLLYFVFIAGEKLSSYQIIGIILMSIGVYFTVKRKSVQLHKTKYGKLI